MCKMDTTSGHERRLCNVSGIQHCCNTKIIIKTTNDSSMEALKRLRPKNNFILFIILGLFLVHCNVVVIVSEVDAFMTMPSPFTNLHHQQSMIHSNSKHSSFSKTCCYMVATTKSGGKPILSVEQFQKEVLLQNFNNVINDDKDENTRKEQPQPKPILVLYSAPWCGPCRLTNPIIQQITKTYTDTITVVEVCTDELPTIAESAGVVSIPTLQLYHDGKCYDTIVGCVTKNVLCTVLDKLLDDLGIIVASDDEMDDSSTVDNADKESSKQ